MSAKAEIKENHLGLTAFECSECGHRFLNHGEYTGDIIAGDGHFTCPNCGVEFDQ